MKTILNIRTPYGRFYQVLDNGDLVVAGVPASGNWKFLGLQHVKRNEFIPLTMLTGRFLTTFDPCWKNGDPQWTVRDRDHRTIRTWGNTKYHGVARIWRVSN